MFFYHTTYLAATAILVATVVAIPVPQRFDVVLHGRSHAAIADMDHFATRAPGAYTSRLLFRRTMTKEELAEAHTEVAKLCGKAGKAYEHDEEEQEYWKYRDIAHAKLAKHPKKSVLTPAQSKKWAEDGKKDAEQAFLLAKPRHH